MPKESFRMHFTRNSQQYWVELERSDPGIVVFRFAFDGPWKAMVASLMDIDQHSLLNNVLKSASFADHGVTDD